MKLDHWIHHYPNIIIVVVLALGFGGCSLLSSNSPDMLQDNNLSEESSAFEMGMEALDQGNFHEATQNFRRVTANDPQYRNALSLIASIPFRRGNTALAQQDYALAIHELNKINSSNPQYAEAQQLISQARYTIWLENYQKTNNPAQQIKAIGRLVDSLNRSQNPELTLKALELLEEKLQTAQPTQYSAILKIFATLLYEQQDLPTLQKGLQVLLDFFSPLHAIPQIRNQLLQLIAELKIQIRTLR